MTAKTYTRSFAGGEISPLLYGRLDLAKNQTGLAVCRNFLVTPQGPIENRPGFQFVIPTRGGTAALIPFTFNAAQSFVLEFGDQYIRFHTGGSTLLNVSNSIANITVANPAVFTVTAHGYQPGNWVFTGDITFMPALSRRWGIVTTVPTADTFTLTDLYGTPISTLGSGPFVTGDVASVYELASPYAVEDVFDLHYVQSADVLTIVHQGYEPRELRRLGVAEWTLTPIPFAPSIGTPGAPTATAHGPGGGTPIVHTYAVTALASGTLAEESQTSPSATADNDLTVDGNYNLVQPPSVNGAARFDIYKLKSGIYGFIGQTDGSAFRDDNFDADLTKTPPLLTNPFAVGAIVSVPVLNGGSGYRSIPLGGGEITGVTVDNGGSGYTVAPTVTAAGAGGSGTGATFTVQLVIGGDAVAAITVDTPGSGYQLPITMTFAGGGGGTGAAATAAATPAVDSVVTAAVSDGGGPGAGAVVKPVVAGGVITGVQVVEPGAGYTSPVVTIVEAAGGTGAVFGDPVLTGSDVFPRAVSYYEQRRIFGGTTSGPQTIWATRSGTESNMTYSIPTQDDDAITARIVAREAQEVRHLVPLNDLIALTSGGVWRITSSDGGALTPATLSVKPQSYVGASAVTPIVTNSSVIYAPDRGAHLRELGFKWETQTFQAEDVSVLAPHLADFHTITQMAYSKSPYQILWAVREDGVLLALTHQPEHEVKAWHQHITDGTFQSVCAVPEGNDDGVYVVTRRFINSSERSYIERMHTRQFATLADAFFVDCGATYSGVPISVVTGLHHLEGETVVILADGGVERSQTVTNGQVTLTAPASTVHVGLPYNADAQTMPLAIEGAPAFGQGMTKNLNQVTLSLYQSSALSVGPSFDRLRENPLRSMSDPYGSPPALKSGIVQIKPDPMWQQDGVLCIRQSAPLPLTVRSISLEVQTGG